MKIVVINLKEREDRLKLFGEYHPNLGFEVVPAVDGKQVGYKQLLDLGFDIQHNWIDPILKTPLTK